MILYLTFNDSPSGIYSSQVIDVVKYMSSELNVRIKLVAFISGRNFFRDREKMKSELPSALVIPMFPGVHRWKMNTLSIKLICFLNKTDGIIGRSVIATNLALRAKVGKVVYDGRGAITEECNEYKVISNPTLLSEIEYMEKLAINNSNYRISVSHKLVEHWQQKFKYAYNDHVIIPCTLNRLFIDLKITEVEIENIRKQFKLEKADVVFVYSGSHAGWQSFDLIQQFVQQMLGEVKESKFIFLCEENSHIQKLRVEFPNKIQCKKVEPKNVPTYLMMSDYGLLIREETITNKVASPVKFAEYLACGLKVIISNNLGDYTKFVLQENVGYLYNDGLVGNIAPLSINERIRNRELALKYLSKSSFKDSYAKLVKQLNG